MIGVDIVKISRIARIISKFGNKFLKRIFTPDETMQVAQYSNQDMKTQHFAKRFAAKEAYTKAMGGLDNNFSLRDIGVKNDGKGKPYLYLHNRLMPNVEISLSDDGDYAIALVMVK